MFEPIVVDEQTLTDKVYDRIREAIVTRQISPGSRITENQISSNLGVSKTPVREALVRLGHVGLVEPAGMRGVRVVAPSRRMISESYQVRIAIETAAVRLAADRRTDDELARMQHLAQQSLSAGANKDSAVYRQVNPELHRTIGASCGNQRLANLIVENTDLLTALRARDSPLLDTSELRGKHHVEIVSAIADRAADRAAELMREHLSAVLRAVLEYHDAEQANT